jgi:tetratricopeptide (TPR) repeat protein
MLWTLSRFDEAVNEAKIAIDLQPTAMFSLRNYGITLYYARRFPEAIHEFRRVSEMDPSFVPNYAWFVPALLVTGNEAEAYDRFIHWQTLMKAESAVIESYKNAYRTRGWKGIGIERIKNFNEDKVRSYFLEAALVAHTGNADKTFEYLEKSYERREWGIPFLRIDPSLDALRNDSRFDPLIRRIHVLPDGRHVFE